MYHVLFDKSATKFKTAILIKKVALKDMELKKHYMEPLKAQGVSESDVVAFSLEYNDKGKCPAKLIKSYLSTLLPALRLAGVENILVCDGAYFKTLTKSRKSEEHYGAVLPCAIKDYEDMNVILCTNYQALFYNPVLQQKIDLSLDTLVAHLNGGAAVLGAGIIHNGYYPSSVQDISDALDALHVHPSITLDIETFSLAFNKAGIGTVGIAWDQHSGISFCCDYQEVATAGPSDAVGKVYGTNQKNQQVRDLLRNFLETYEGKVIYHNANFDCKVLVYVLWMQDLLDQKGMLEGIECVTKNFGDTKLITYLATNSCAGNRLSLKEIAHEFAGNYAQSDINNICLISRESLLEYNLVDCLSTWYAYNKHHPGMIQDNQEEVYNTIMLPSVKVILQMELTGMCLDMAQVRKAQSELQAIAEAKKDYLKNSKIIQAFNIQLRKEAMFEANLLLKKKVKPISDFDHVVFNPASSKQVANLIYTFLKYDVIDKTDTGLPATGAKTIKKVLARVTDPEHREIFESLNALSEVSKILSTFINAFISKSILKPDGFYYLHGSFNLGGTVSGRLSSSKPNLQNIPSSSTYAKIIKKCFVAPPGWLMVGPDFNSLEDYISALTTKDPNKLKVYIEGYDGHCLRAYSYFKKEMPDIIDTVDSINSIKTAYPDLRQDSKAPTFALTYQGTWVTLMNNLGMPPEKAKSIEANYHDMYQVSDQWVQDKLSQASQDGFVTVAFGLRVRTPMLAKTMLNRGSTPYEAAAEGRTAGNALGQSYGLLNNRAAIEFQERTLRSEYAMDIRPIAHIHDAQYFLIRNNVGCVHWVNENLIDCMEWQELPEIQHDQVKIGAELDIFYPTWADVTTIPNGSSKAAILKLC